MSTYTDALKRTWNLNVTVRTVRDIKQRVRDKHGKQVDLMDLVFGQLAFDLLSDVHMLSEILWLICEPQAMNGTSRIKKEDYFASLYGDTLEDAETALLEALADFFPKEQRTAFEMKIEKVRSLLSATWTNEQRQMDHNVMELMDQTPKSLPENPPAESTSGGLSTAAGESSAVTPTA